MQTQTPQEPQHVQSAAAATKPPWFTIAAAAILAVLAFVVGVVVGSADIGDDVRDAPAVVGQWSEAFVSGDPEALTALHAESGTFNCRAFDFTIGRNEIVDVVMQDETDFTEFKPTTVLVGDEIIAVEYQVSATSPSGKEVTTPLLAVFDCRSTRSDRSVDDRLRRR